MHTPRKLPIQPVRYCSPVGSSSSSSVGVQERQPPYCIKRHVRTAAGVCRTQCKTTPIHQCTLPAQHKARQCCADTQGAVWIWGRRVQLPCTSVLCHEPSHSISSGCSCQRCESKCPPKSCLAAQGKLQCVEYNWRGAVDSTLLP